MKHNDRLSAILELIKTNVVETQGDLMKLLRDSGYDVTQATVSRDIKKLNLHKVHDANNKYRYVSGTQRNIDGEQTLIQSCVIGVESALNDVVIKCKPGAAQAVSSLIDSMDNELIIGTVAGDDTILVIARSEASAKLFCDHFKTLTNI